MPVELDGFLAFAPEVAASDAGCPQHYFPELARVEAGSFWYRGRNRLIVCFLREYCAHASSLFEVGCGTGFVLSGIRQAMPHLRLTGSEIGIFGLPFAAKRLPDAQLLQMHAGRIPFTEEFDAAGAFDVLEHIEEDVQVLGEVHRALRPGGVLLITVPQHPRLWSRMDDISHHVRRYTARELRDKLTAVGFRVRRMTSFMTFLAPVLFVVRRLGIERDESADGMQELRVGGVINALMGSTLALERTVIRAGINLPFGGSLLVACQRADQ